MRCSFALSPRLPAQHDGRKKERKKETRVHSFRLGDNDPKKAEIYHAAFGRGEKKAVTTCPICSRHGPFPAIFERAETGHGLQGVCLLER